MSGPFKLRSGNTTPFKQMGSSPLKQAIGGGAGEAIEHWKKYKQAKKVGTIRAVGKEITRVAKGGKVQAELIASRKLAEKKAVQKAAKKKTIKTLAKKVLSRAIPVVGAGLIGWDAGSIVGRMRHKKQSLGEAIKGHYLGKEPKKKEYHPPSTDYWNKKFKK